MTAGVSRQRDILDTLVRETMSDLGLTEPLELRVLRAASGDPEYARRLVDSRGDRARLHELLEHPPAMPAATEEISDLDLALHGARSLWDWLRSGCDTVSNAEHTRRVDVCRRCIHVRELPARLLYELAAFGLSTGLTCAMCGCVVERKAWLPSGGCPSEDPEQAGFDRWGQALRKVREN
jgi:hypothetical protein